MTPRGFKGVGQLLNGRCRIRVTDGLGPQPFQHRPHHLPVPDPLPHPLSFLLVHVHIVPQTQPLAQCKLHPAREGRITRVLSEGFAERRSVSGSDGQFGQGGGDSVDDAGFMEELGQLRHVAVEVL